MTKVLHISGTTTNTNQKPTKLEVFFEQLLDSGIVAGITALSTYISAGADASVKSAVLAFALMFLLKLKEYRKIK